MWACSCPGEQNKTKDLNHEEVIWREVRGHSTKPMENGDIIQRLGFHREIRQPLGKETEEVSKDTGSPEGHRGDIFKKGKKSNFCTRLCLLWATLTFLTILFPCGQCLSALMLSEKKQKSKFCVHIKNWFSTKVQKAIQQQKNRFLNKSSAPDAGTIKYPNGKKKEKTEEKELQICISHHTQN